MEGRVHQEFESRIRQHWWSNTRTWAKEVEVFEGNGRYVFGLPYYLHCANIDSITSHIVKLDSQPRPWEMPLSRWTWRSDGVDEGFPLWFAWLVASIPEAMESVFFLCLHTEPWKLLSAVLGILDHIESIPCFNVPFLLFLPSQRTGNVWKRCACSISKADLCRLNRSIVALASSILEFSTWISTPRISSPASLDSASCLHCISWNRDLDVSLISFWMSNIMLRDRSDRCPQSPYPSICRNICLYLRSSCGRHILWWTHWRASSSLWQILGRKKIIRLVMRWQSTVWMRGDRDRSVTWPSYPSFQSPWHKLWSFVRQRNLSQTGDAVSLHQRIWRRKNFEEVQAICAILERIVIVTCDRKISKNMWESKEGYQRYVEFRFRNTWSKTAV